MAKVLRSYGIRLTKKVGLYFNNKKTKVMAFKTFYSIVLKIADGQMKVKKVEKVEKVEKDFKYLGFWINSSEIDIKVRKALE